MSYTFQAQPYTAEQVLALYSQISMGGSRAAKDQANLQILQLPESQQAWQIASQLIQPNRQQQDQFIGA